MMAPRFVLRWLGFLLALGTAALLLTAGCQHAPEAAVPGAPVAKADSDFVGNAACAECHAAEFKAHHGSRHDITLRTADRKSLGDLAPEPGVVPLAGYALTEANGKLALSRTVPTAITQPLDYVLGSGKFGMTFVTLRDGGSLEEAHTSYFPARHTWEVTPGQEEPHAGDDVFGRPDSPTASRRCLGCHTTTLPEQDLHPEPKFFGVGCESCHGAGRKHIAGMKAGGSAAEAHLEKLGAWKGSRLNELCGKCHRNTADVDPMDVGAMQTYRFQPYALNRSACRMADGEPLSCLQCHDPHANVSTNTKAYEAGCLKCHAPNRTHAASAIDGGKGKVCPVNAKEGCIGCHMRPRVAFPKTFIPGTMVDHLISRPR